LDQIQDGGWPPSLKISNGHRARPIDFVFDPRVGFSETADRMALFPVSPNPRWRLAAILENFNDLSSGLGHPIDFTFDPRVGF